MGPPLGRHLSMRCRTNARRLRSTVHPKPSQQWARLSRSGDDARALTSYGHCGAPRRPWDLDTLLRPRRSGLDRHVRVPGSRWAPPRLRRSGAALAQTPLSILPFFGSRNLCLLDGTTIGRGVSRPRHEARARRRDQGPARRRVTRTPIASRGSSAKRKTLASLNHPQHRRDLRPRGCERRHGPGDGTGRGADARRSHCARRDSTRRSAADRAADRRGARSRARAGDHPSRSEARQHQGARRTAR